jgi:multidrug resistance efflux pump
VNLSRKHILTAAVVALAVIVVLLKYGAYVLNPWTRDGQIRAEVVQITPRVSGPIVTLPIVDNQFVKAGDLLFEIDPRTYKASLDQARAQYDMTGDNYQAQEKEIEGAEAQITASKAQIRQAQSSIKQLDAQIVKDKAEFERQQDLLPKRATSQKSVDRARANYDVSLEQREGALATAAQAHASLAQAQAALRTPGESGGRPGTAEPGIHPGEGPRGWLYHQPEPAPGLPGSRQPARTGTGGHQQLLGTWLLQGNLH